MGQIKAKLIDELTLSVIVHDLAQSSGDDESDVCILLAKIVDADWNREQLKFFCKVPSNINLRKMRNTEIHSGTISTRLQKVARSGWAKVAPILCGNSSVHIDEVRIEKDSIIKALEENHLLIPDSWIGIIDSQETVLTRLAIKQEFRQFNLEQWEKHFDREKKNGLFQCRAAHKQGKFVLYKHELIKSWLITRGRYKKPKLLRPKKQTHNIAEQLILAGQGKP